MSSQNYSNWIKSIFLVFILIHLLCSFIKLLHIQKYVGSEPTSSKKHFFFFLLMKYIFVCTISKTPIYDFTRIPDYFYTIPMLYISVI